MKFNNKIFLFVLFLILPVAVAETTVQVNEVYPLGTSVTITGTCTDNGAVALMAGIGLNTIWVDEVTANPTFTATFLPPQKATYTLLAACENDLAVQTTFCVGTNDECGVVQPQPDPDPSSSSSSSSGSGGGGCTSQWQCGLWSYCNASLKQTKTCQDLKRCQQNKIEVQNCTKCDESWICSLWSDCQNNRQTRTCTDQHYCDATTKKPVLSKTCDQTASGPAPAGYTGQQPQPPQVQQPVTSFWDQYKIWIITGPSTLLLIIIIILLILHFTKKKEHMHYNFNELKEWIRKEKEMGTSNEDVKQILAEQTGWTAEEITNAFSELHGSEQQP